MTGDPLAPLRDSARVLLSAAERLLKISKPREPTLAALQFFSDPQSHFVAMLEPITWRLEDFAPSHSQNAEESERDAEHLVSPFTRFEALPSAERPDDEKPAVASRRRTASRPGFEATQAANRAAPKSITGNKLDMRASFAVADPALQAMGALNLFPPPRQEIQESSAPVQAGNRPKQKAEETKQDFFSVPVEVRAPGASAANANQIRELKTEARPTAFHQTNRMPQFPSPQRFSQASEDKVAGSSLQDRSNAWQEGPEAHIQPSSAMPRGVRMAQGAPRLAAILQANASALEKIERPALKNADSPAGQIAAELHPVKSESTPSRPIDLDELIKCLAEQLELDLIRTYGTSAR